MTFTRSWFATLILFLAVTCCSGKNLLPNGSFELGVSGRDYQFSTSVFPSRYSELMATGSAFHGEKCLALPTGTYRLSSRMVHSSQGPHVLSFYTRLQGGGTVNIAAQIRRNPFEVEQSSSGFSSGIAVNSSSWGSAVATGTLPEAKGGWYWMQMDVTVGQGQVLYLDAFMLESGTVPTTHFVPAQDVEFSLDMPGDFTRIYTENEPLGPLQIKLYYEGGPPVSRDIEIVIKDFFRRTVYENEMTISIPAGTGGVTITEVPLTFGKKGPFRAQLYLAGDLIQDELIFSVVPDISQPVLATQYANGSSDLRYMYKTLGFRYGGSHTPTQWKYIQPDGPNQWSWDALDAWHDGVNENFDEITQIMLWSPPQWAYDKTNKITPFPPSFAPDKQFDLEDYLNYIEAVTRRYPDWLYIQPWNEPWSWEPVEFVEFLRRCRERLDLVNPSIQILAPTVWPRMGGWMTNPQTSFIAMGGLQYTDIFAHHTYGCCGGFFPDDLDVLKDWAHADGNTSRPIWDVETALHPFNVMSWYTFIMPSNTGSYSNGTFIASCNTAEEGTERFTRMYITQTAMGSELFFSHVAPNAVAPLPRITHMVHAEPDGGRHPMAIGWAVAGHRIGSAQAHGELELNSDLQPHLRVMLFEDNEAIKAVIWTRDFEGDYPAISDPIAAGLYLDYDVATADRRGKFRTIIERSEMIFSIPLDSSKTTLYDMFDNIVAPATFDDRIRFSVSCRPMYLEVTGMSLSEFAEVLNQGELSEIVSYQMDRPFADWAEIDGQPMTYGPWSLMMGKASDLSNWSSYEPMVYDSSIPGGRWQSYYDTADPYHDGTPKSRAFDHYGVWPCLQAAGSASPRNDWRTIPALVFTSPTDGYYEFFASDASGENSDNAGFQFVADNDGQFIRWYKTSLDHCMTAVVTVDYQSGLHWTEPQTFDSLRGAWLGAGEKLVMAVSNSSVGGYWWGASVYTGDSAPGTTEHGMISVNIKQAAGTCADVLASGAGSDFDINLDCNVDMLDLMHLASAWLFCNHPTDQNCRHDW